MMAHRLWIGSITFVDWLQASAKRVVLLYISIVRLNACWAPLVMLQDTVHSDIHNQAFMIVYRLHTAKAK